MKTESIELSFLMPWSHRYIGNPMLSMLARLLFSCRVSDFHCGIRGFNRNRLENLELNCRGMEFATEMIVTAALARYRIEEVPVRLSPGVPGRCPHLRSIPDGLRHMRVMGNLLWTRFRAEPSRCLH